MCIEKLYIMRFGDAIFYRCQLGLVNNVVWDFSNRSFLSKFFINNEKSVKNFYYGHRFVSFSFCFVS